MKNFFKKISTFLKSLHQFITRDIWRQDFSKVSTVQKVISKQIIVVYLVARSYVEDRLPVRASALVYSTMLSIMPLLAVTFSLFKGFGYHKRIEPKLVEFVEPLGQNAVNFVPKIVNELDTLDLTAFGFTGLAILIISVFSIINNVERAFNDVWRVKKSRSIQRRFADYAGLFLAIPILLLGIPSINAYLQSIHLFQLVRQAPGLEWLITKITPLIVAWFVFAFLYIFVPNTKVRFSSALIGALVAGTLWHIANSYFTGFLIGAFQGGIRQALYAGFSAFLLFLIWLYLSWTIVLLGAEMSYAHQNQSKITWDIRRKQYSYAFSESLAIKIILFVGESFLNGKDAPSHDEISTQLNIPERVMNEVISTLVELRFLYALDIDNQNESYTPARSLDNLTIKDIIDGIRNRGMVVEYESENDPFRTVVADIEHKYDKLLEDTFGDQTIHDLLTGARSDS